MARQALTISAPDDIRSELRRLRRSQQVARCASLRDRSALSTKHSTTIRALRSTAQRVRHLQAEARELENELLQLLRQQAPELLKLLGVGPITAAQILVSWSHPGRFRSEAAFASFAGVAPIPASSGLTNKHRLNRGGDRQPNRAMHTITLIRMGKSSRDAQRCLKGNICRQIFKPQAAWGRARGNDAEGLATVAAPMAVLATTACTWRAHPTKFSSVRSPVYCPTA